MQALSLPWIVLYGLWLAWGISWWIASRWSSAAASAASRSDQARYRILTIVGAALLFLPVYWLPVNTSLYASSDLLTWLCALLAFAGFAFCWWARLHLGTLWSANVTRKDDHHIVDTGPYGLVRHPIYTGIILAALAVGIAKGTGIAFAGVAVFALSFYIKARLEEKFLRQELGTAAYDAYGARIPMLVPFSPFG